MFAGLPVVFTELGSAQDFTFHSRAVVSAFLTDARPTTVPEGVTVHSAADVAADALDPLQNAITSIDLVRGLLWFVTAVIIGAVVVPVGPGAPTATSPSCGRWARPGARC